MEFIPFLPGHCQTTKPRIIQNLNAVRFADGRSMTMLLELPAAFGSSQQEGLASFGEPPVQQCWLLEVTRRFE